MVVNWCKYDNRRTLNTQKTAASKERTGEGVDKQKWPKRESKPENAGSV